MAASFTNSQDAGNLTGAIFTDTSTGLVSVTGRLIYLRKYDGTYLVPSGTTTDYVFWPIGDTTITIDVLDKDYSLEVTVVCYSGSSAAYTSISLVYGLFTGYSEIFLRRLTQAVADNRMLVSSKNYWANKQQLRTLVDDAGQAVSLINDQTIATFALNEAKKLTDNPSLFFG